MANVFDCAVIGMGIAGCFAAYNLATKHKGIKILAIEASRKPQKRRSQMMGFFGCFPSGDGKLYLNDINKVAELTGTRKAKSANNYVNGILSNINDFEIIKDKPPSISMEKKLTKHDYQITLNDHVQMYPKDIHALSKHIAETIESKKNITFSFDNEVRSVRKQKGMFVISSDEGEFHAKKLVIAVGRSGWRWARDLFAGFGIIEDNDIAQFGIRMEMNSTTMKDFVKSNCTLNKGGVEIGPLCWNGTVIPEDHVDLAISAFRSNEARWKSDKVSFNLIGHVSFPNRGFEETDRVGKLTFLLANDRIIRERVSTVLSGKSKISIIPEYKWLPDAIRDLGQVIPEVMNKAYFHVPTIIPLAPRINVGPDLSTEVDGMFVAGESSGLLGILSAAITGSIVGSSVAK